MSDHGHEQLRQKAFQIGDEAMVLTGAYDQYDLGDDRFIQSAHDLGEPHTVTLLYTDTRFKRPLLHKYRFDNPRYSEDVSAVVHSSLFDAPTSNRTRPNLGNTLRETGVGNKFKKAVGNYVQDCGQQIGNSKVLLGALTLYMMPKKPEDNILDPRLLNPHMVFAVPTGFMQKLICTFMNVNSVEEAVTNFDSAVEANSKSDSPEFAKRVIEKQGVEGALKRSMVANVLPLMLQRDRMSPVFREILFDV